jgi:cytochrome c oxidase subunit 3
MSYTLAFLALILGVVVWWLLKQTFNLKPWAASASPEAVRAEGVRSPSTMIPLPPVKLALGVFLAVVTSLFALFISAYAIRMEYGDWRPMPEPVLLWVNSGILVLSSVFLQAGWNAAKRGNIATLRFGVASGGALAVAFIVGQLMAWYQLTTSGYLISGNPANAFFYLITGVHALHLIGGLVALAKTVRRVWHSDDMAAMTLGVELCAVYWHYLLAVWVIVFGFMLST